MQVLADLQNGSLGLEELYSKLSGKTIANQHDNNSVENREPSTVPTRLKLVAMNAPARFVITVDKNAFTIGKKDSNDAVITFNKMISRVHCKVTGSRGQYWITDLQSSNGTYINNMRLQPNQPHKLESGDIVRMANSDFQAVID